MTQELLKLALEALEDACGECCNAEYNPCFQRKAITAIKKALAQPEQCQCPNCRVTLHASDCAVHNEPAYPKGACNCGAQPEQEPVAWQVMVEDEAMKEFSIKDMAHDWCVQQKLSASPYAYWIRPLYTTPPQRKPQEFVCSTGLCHYRKPLTNDRAHQILLDMAKHIETFGDENITEQALSAECIRFILERVTAYGIKEEV